MSEEVNYSLFRSDIFDDIIDFNQFFEIFSYNAIEIGDGFGLHPHISKSSLSRMHRLYLEDLKRVLKHGIARGSDELDHFKQAALLCFWFRRTSPIHRLKPNLNPIEKAALESDPQGNLLLGTLNYRDYPNEITAFLIGARICMYFEDSVIGNEINIDMVIQEDIGIYDIIADNMREIGAILQSKNISFHALYIMYKFLFVDFASFTR